MHDSPDARELLLVGGGHAHVAVLRSFGMRPLPGLRITVVSRELETPYSGMLPGLVAGHYGFDDVHIDLAPLARFCGARLVHGEVEAVAAAAGEVRLVGGRQLRFDLLSVNSGIVPTMAGITGECERVLQVKPISRFLPHWQAALRDIEAAPDQPCAVTVVGGGAGGVELALAVAHRLQSAPGVEVRLVTSDAQVVPAFNARARRRLAQALLAAGVDVRTGMRVSGVQACTVSTDSGVQVPADVVLWTTDAAAPAWLARSDLATDAEGFLSVDAHLASTSHAQVFGAGDAVTLTHAPRPRSGVFAVRAGPVLADNLRAAALELPLRRWRPQYHFLSLVSTGDGRAVASRGAWAAQGRWVWRWKDHIDRRFMDRFQLLPAAMAGARPAQVVPLPGADEAPLMRCGGCGAKLGAQLLDRVLERLELEQAGQADGVQVGLAARDDAAVISPGRGQLAITVDGFRSFVSDPYVFGRLAAVHALGDVYAMGARPHGVLALATVPHAAEALMADDLYQMMAGGLSALNEAGAPLLGGHSAEGAELSLGFTALGRIGSEGAITKAGVRIGDALILTQPLGTGVLFAAAGEGRARSRWLTAAIDHMQQLPAVAADILVAHGVRAMTDVTGFGLLGHAAEMARASNRQIDIHLEAVPALDGALACLGAGLASSLQANNRQVLADFEQVDLAADDPRLQLLVDPQTCGGLLASVPGAQADACVAALRAGGYPAACVVGRARRQVVQTGASGRLLRAAATATGTATA